MVTIIQSLLTALVSLFWSRAKLHHEILILRHHLNVLRRTSPERVALTNVDRLFLDLSFSVWPGVLRTVRILRPETIVRWHRHGFHAYWRWRSRGLPGRPRVPKDVRDLIREISLANPLWGAPRIHGEILKLGIDVAQSTVAKYMVKHRRPPSPSWRTFLHHHADGIAPIDLFVAPTVTFKLLFGFVVLHHERRQLLAVAVTAHPTASRIGCGLHPLRGRSCAPRRRWPWPLDPPAWAARKRLTPNCSKNLNYWLGLLLVPRTPRLGVMMKLAAAQLRQPLLLLGATRE
jgi:hypothetical protein